MPQDVTVDSESGMNPTVTNYAGDEDDEDDSDADQHMTVLNSTAMPVDNYAMVTPLTGIDSNAFTPFVSSFVPTRVESGMNATITNYAGDEDDGDAERQMTVQYSTQQMTMPVDNYAMVTPLTGIGSNAFTPFPLSFVQTIGPNGDTLLLPLNPGQGMTSLGQQQPCSSFQVNQNVRTHFKMSLHKFIIRIINQFWMQLCFQVNY